MFLPLLLALFLVLLSALLIVGAVDTWKNRSNLMQASIATVMFFGSALPATLAIMLFFHAAQGAFGG